MTKDIWPADKLAQSYLDKIRRGEPIKGNSGDATWRAPTDFTVSHTRVENPPGLKYNPITREFEPIESS